MLKETTGAFDGTRLTAYESNAQPNIGGWSNETYMDWSERYIFFIKIHLS